jgi:thiol-disulfide isomerase/thioredoxin
MRRVIAGAVLVCAASAAVLGLIMGISPFLSSAEAPACSAPPEDLASFKATTPASPVVAAAFLENGDTRRTLADLKGRGVVLNFWATWCAPCVREMPALDRLQAEAGGDFHVLALSSDRGGAPVVEKFYAKTGIKNLANLIDEKRRVLKALKVRGLPTTVLIDPAGKEVGRILGAAEWDAPETVAFLRACIGAGGKSMPTAAHGGAA